MAGCNGGIGWMGYIKLCNYLLPYRSADITKVTEIVPSESILGGGYSALSAAQVNPVWRDDINFIIGKELTEGSISTSVFAGTGNYFLAWKELFKRAVGDSSANGNDMSLCCAGFSDSCKLLFAPAGGTEISLPKAGRMALVSEMSIKGNLGGEVGADFKIMSAGADWNTPPSVSSPATSDLAFESAGFADDSNPVPWYSTNVTVTGSGETFDISDYITDFNFTVNNNTQPLFFFNGINYPYTIFLGKRRVSGSFSYYSPTGAFIEKLSHGASIVMTLGSIQVTMPFVAFGKGPVPSQGANKEVVRNQEFTAFAKSATEPAIYWTAI
jgi:hypothetical protein